MSSSPSSSVYSHVHHDIRCTCLTCIANFECLFLRNATKKHPNIVFVQTTFVHMDVIGDNVSMSFHMSITKDNATNAEYQRRMEYLLSRDDATFQKIQSWRKGETKACHLSNRIAVRDFATLFRTMTIVKDQKSDTPRGILFVIRNDYQDDKLKRSTASSVPSDGDIDSIRAAAKKLVRSIAPVSLDGRSNYTHRV